jgi:hypothetical protein
MAIRPFLVNGFTLGKPPFAPTKIHCPELESEIGFGVLGVGDSDWWLVPGTQYSAPPPNPKPEFLNSKQILIFKIQINQKI